MRSDLTPWRLGRRAPLGRGQMGRDGFSATVLMLRTCRSGVRLTPGALTLRHHDPKTANRPRIAIPPSRAQPATHAHHTKRSEPSAASASPVVAVCRLLNPSENAQRAGSAARTLTVRAGSTGWDSWCPQRPYSVTARRSGTASQRRRCPGTGSTTAGPQSHRKSRRRNR